MDMVKESRGGNRTEGGWVMGDRENNKSKKSGVNLCNLVVAKFHKDEKAQAIALGFVIIMGILLTATILLLSTELPKQTKVLEAEHATKVPQDFAELGSAIDGVALSGDETASATCAVGMTSKHVPFVGIQASGGTLRFDNSRERFECLACSPEEPIVTGTDSWNCTPTEFMSMSYTKYHVDTNEDEGAKLKLEAGEDRKYKSGGEEYLSGDFCFNNFTVTNNTTLSTHLLTIHAINITIDSGSSITATGGGLFGGDNNEDGSGLGYGHTPGYRGAGAGGAGYNSTGGGGGKSDLDTGAQGGFPYGNETDRSTADFGSGGGGGGDAWHRPGKSAPFGGKGGDGGGAIFLDAPLITIYGTVSANGDDGLKNTEQATHGSGAGGGGGGSGGTILLEGNNITITGNLSVKGGKGGGGGDADDVTTPSGYGIPSGKYIPGGGGGGGSGGRIKVFFSKLYGSGGPVTNVEQFFDTHINVSGGAGGIRGSGKVAGSTLEAENGTAGGIGSVHNESISTYVESVPHYSAGYMISSINDTGHINNTAMILYGNITWAKTTLSGTNIYIKVRTSLNATMSDAMPWENCPAATNGQDLSELYSVSDGHRYIQWRADLTTMERSRTPILKSVNISYERGRPVISDSSGSIEFSSHYFNLPNYVLVYEHGATIKNQTVGGEIMLFAPPISITNSGTTTALTIHSVNLIGDNETAGGVFSSAVKVSYRNTGVVVGGLDFHNLSLNITTAYPTAWSRWFNKTCKAAGLGPEEYKIIGSGTAAQPLSIVFYGNDSRPVNLWLKESEVDVDVEG